MPFSAKHLDAVELTHAHVDHSGALPLLTKQGFSATAALCRILLPDAAHLQEQDAEYANRKGFSRHRPALPLYDQHDVQRTLEQLHSHRFEQAFQPAKGSRPASRTRATSSGRRACTCRRATARCSSPVISVASMIR